jgi:hypothetical protein
MLIRNRLTFINDWPVMKLFKRFTSLFHKLKEPLLNHLYMCEICKFAVTSPQGLSDHLANHRVDHHGGPRS